MRTLVLAIAVVFTTVAGQAQVRNLDAQVIPLVGSDGVPQGAAFRAALEISLAEGLHANSNKPRDPLLIPMVLAVEPPPGVTVTEIVYPPATDLKQEISEEPLSVFEREFAIGVSISVARDVAPGELTIPAKLRYQACDEKMCYRPVTVDTGWSVRVVPAGTAVNPLHVDALAGIAFGRGEAPSAAPLLMPRAPSSPPPAVSADVVTQLAGFTTAGRTAGYMGASDFIDFIRNAEAGVQEQGWFDNRGPLAILLIVLVGGLALNLTPCVLPMIPINLAIIGAGAQAGSRSRGFLLGGAYGAAMAVVYGVLGLLVILTAGTFGTINASPWFNAGIAALFVVLALAMFDVLVIDFSRFGSRFQVAETGRGTFLVAFAMGGIAALLAGACVAPVVIQVVLFSSNLYATGTAAALALPFLLGVGMAIPWPLAGAGIAALPRPGAWMVRVKQVFGVIILATAVYYGFEAYRLFADRWVDPAEVSSSVEEKAREGWYTSLDQGLTAAASEQKPVLIDFWATWCKSCLVMDRTTLKNADVNLALANYVKIKFQAENPDESPTKEVMERLGAIGLPTYAILKPR
jgi:cytochrome c biogenesis protein CcdA/thiol-disulfide isomerase/thioredoxin